MHSLQPSRHTPRPAPCNQSTRQSLCINMSSLLPCEIGSVKDDGSQERVCEPSPRSVESQAALLVTAWLSCACQVYTPLTLVPQIVASHDDDVLHGVSGQQEVVDTTLGPEWSEVLETEAMESNGHRSRRKDKSWRWTLKGLRPAMLLRAECGSRTLSKQSWRSM